VEQRGVSLAYLLQLIESGTVSGDLTIQEVGGLGKIAEGAQKMTRRWLALFYLSRCTAVERCGRLLLQVVDTFVRPSSARQLCCLFDLVPPSFRGRPRCFVSHVSLACKLEALGCGLWAELHFHLILPGRSSPTCRFALTFLL
jgi:hypothetical protein